jgi:hypothetical protein
MNNTTFNGLAAGQANDTNGAQAMSLLDSI